MLDSGHVSSLDSPQIDRREGPAKKFRPALRRLNHQQAEEEAKVKETMLMQGNPLINMNNSISFNVKRRWDEDFVFNNRTRGETKTPKRFINDTIRSDFHRKFFA
ncbi:hypothetical protein QYE76_020512 [Lolium multiflorum]|uniref:Uncharacterized protein n=1 Tax=Lolium multiflorum TaxID=4521 RepID=A0AAD8R6E1_LOLMU|nr:hypothetical protein QYE76_020509 [Lolium multiflorum]KAK1614995.1 hypothetical protein QYE76_020512 [Lolium multiflorum]